jgi:hypothetical protein
MVRRSAVSLGRPCDSACVFCAQAGLDPVQTEDAEVERQLTDARTAGADAVTFVGGEPAVDPRLEGFVTKARTLGFSQVGVQTNGWVLSGPGRVQALVAAGLTDLHLSIHGAEARAHDWHVGRAGAFDAALRTLSAARAAGLAVAVTTVVTRSSFRGLASMARLLQSRGVAAWCLQVPRWRGRAATGADRVVPRLALAIPFALHAVDAAGALGLPAFVSGAPSCLLGPWASRALAVESRGFGEACAACDARTTCTGVDPEYLARFGEGELIACPAVASDDRHAALRALFVGVGELALPTAAAIAPPPARARVGLPLLGRPSPARAEVAGSAPKQTGEALKAILPGLFGEEPRKEAPLRGAGATNPPEEPRGEAPLRGAGSTNPPDK